MDGVNARLTRVGVSEGHSGVEGRRGREEKRCSTHGGGIIRTGRRAIIARHAETNCARRTDLCLDYGCSGVFSRIGAVPERQLRRRATASALHPGMELAATGIG